MEAVGPRIHSRLLVFALSLATATGIALGAISSARGDDLYIGALGGLSYSTSQNGESNRPLGGAEITYGVHGLVQLGMFYWNNWLNSEGGVEAKGSRAFYGGIVRVGVPLSGFFLDGEFGLTRTSVGSLSSGSHIGYGAGMGYRIPFFPFLDLAPRVGVRSVRGNETNIKASSTLIDVGLLLTLGFDS